MARERAAWPRSSRQVEAAAAAARAPRLEVAGVAIVDLDRAVDAVAAGVAAVEVDAAAVEIDAEELLISALRRRVLGAGGTRRDYLRARFANGKLTIFDSQDSGRTFPLAAANALVIREIGAPAVAAGAMASYIDIA